VTEDNFLSELFKQLPPASTQVIVPPGDDCAVFTPAQERQQVIAADQLIEGRHYLKRTAAKLCGRKLLARNLSDIAAMGAKPEYAILTCKLSEECDESWLMEFHRGLLDLAAEFDVQLIGGDLARGPGPSNFSLTITGSVDKPITRSGAQAGDLLYATGSFGLSFETEHHLNFQARVNEGLYLNKLGVTKAMIDITDGLLLDSKRLLKAANQELDLQFFTESIPRRQYKGKAASLEQALTNGEDYELVFAVSAQDEKKLLENWTCATPLTKIGLFQKGTEQILDQDKESLESLMNQTYDHLRKS
jgi:thiamine-monophosphate kinase